MWLLPYLQKLTRHEKLRRPSRLSTRGRSGSTVCVRRCEDRKANPISPRINPKNWSFWHNPGTETGVILCVVVAEQGDHGSKDNEDEDTDGDRQHRQTSRP